MSEAEARERLAAWMIENSFATGHGDTLEDLLGELTWHWPPQTRIPERSSHERA
jgi:hypothetical protein